MVCSLPSIRLHGFIALDLSSMVFFSFVYIVHKNWFKTYYLCVFVHEKTWHTAHNLDISCYCLVYGWMRRRAYIQSKLFTSLCVRCCMSCTISLLKNIKPLNRIHKRRTSPYSIDTLHRLKAANMCMYNMLALISMFQKNFAVPSCAVWIHIFYFYSFFALLLFFFISFPLHCIAFFILFWYQH